MNFRSCFIKVNPYTLNYIQTFSFFNFKNIQNFLLKNRSNPTPRERVKTHPKRPESETFKCQLNPQRKKVASTQPANPGSSSGKVLLRDPMQDSNRKYHLGGMVFILKHTHKL